jgi:predicted Fe-Mo cluster-binding NifX family protein
MIIAIPTTGTKPDDPCDERFGRAKAFFLVDADTLEWSFHDNPAQNASGGAGVQAAQFLADLKVEIVMSGSFGPKAYDALDAAGIKMLLLPSGASLTGREALHSFQTGSLLPASGPSHTGGHGGRGRRGGRA